MIEIKIEVTCGGGERWRYKLAKRNTKLVRTQRRKEKKMRILNQKDKVEMEHSNSCM